MDKDVLVALVAIIPLCVTLYTVFISAIRSWERVQEKKDAEHIRAVVALHFKEKLEEVKERYAEVVALLKSGTLK